MLSPPSSSLTTSLISLFHHQLLILFSFSPCLPMLLSSPILRLFTCIPSHSLSRELSAYYLAIIISHPPLFSSFVLSVPPIAFSFPYSLFFSICSSAVILLVSSMQIVLQSYSLILVFFSDFFSHLHVLVSFPFHLHPLPLLFLSLLSLPLFSCDPSRELYADYLYRIGAFIEHCEMLKEVSYRSHPFPPSSSASTIASSSSSSSSSSYATNLCHQRVCLSSLFPSLRPSWLLSSHPLSFIFSCFFPLCFPASFHLLLIKDFLLSFSFYLPCSLL